MRDRLGRIVGLGIDEFVGASTWVFSGRLIALAVNFAVAVIVARWYGPEAAGLVALLNSASLLFGTLAVFGQGTFLIRELGSSDVTVDSHRKRRLYLRSLALVSMISAGLLAPTIFALMQRLPEFSLKTVPLALAIVSGTLLGRTFIVLTVNMSRALAPASVYSGFLLLPALINLLIVTACASVSEGAPLVPSAAAAIGSLVAGAAAVSYNMFRLRQAVFSADSELPRTDRAKEAPTNVALLRAGLPFLIANGASVVVAEGSVVVAGFLLPASEIGVFSVAHKASIMAAFALTSISLVAQPRFARLVVGGDLAKMRDYGRQVSKLIFLVSAPIILALFLTRHWLIDTAFGPEFSRASELLSILLVGQTTAAFTGATNPFLSMSGGQNTLSKIIALSALISILLTVLLTPALGIKGPAIAMSASLAFWNIAALLTIRLREGFWLCWLPSFAWPLKQMSSGHEGDL